jgi:hypothetical protein
MATIDQTTQSGIKQYDHASVVNYALFMGGTNTTYQSLTQYNILRGGYARIFFVKMPVFMEAIMPEKTKWIRHILQYGFTKIDGIENLTLETEQVTGGYAGNSFDVATQSKDGTNTVTMGLYEFGGSPIREYMQMWVTGISDQETGIATYHGALDLQGKYIKYGAQNHVAEAIYVATDPTGRYDGIEYACLLTNMMPKTVKKDHFNYNSGDHPVVQIDVDFTCKKFESPQINEIAKALVAKYDFMKDYLGFKSEYTASSIDSLPKYTINNWPDDVNSNSTIS